MARTNPLPELRGDSSLPIDEITAVTSSRQPFGPAEVHQAIELPVCTSNQPSASWSSTSIASLGQMPGYCPRPCKCSCHYKAKIYWADLIPWQFGSRALPIGSGSPFSRQSRCDSSFCQQQSWTNIEWSMRVPDWLFKFAPSFRASCGSVRFALRPTRVGIADRHLLQAFEKGTPAILGLLKEGRHVYYPDDETPDEFLLIEVCFHHPAHQSA